MADIRSGMAYSTPPTPFPPAHDPSYPAPPPFPRIYCFSCCLIYDTFVEVWVVLVPILIEINWFKYSFLTRTPISPRLISPPTFSFNLLDSIYMYSVFARIFLYLAQYYDSANSLREAFHIYSATITTALSAPVLFVSLVSIVCSMKQ